MSASSCERSRRVRRYLNDVDHGKIPGGSRKVNVTVNTPGGKSAAGSADDFSYVRRRQ